MQCPVCQKNMTEEDFGGVRVDVCKDGCKGIWFDWSELVKLDESHEGTGDALCNALDSEHHKDDNRGRINCPKCQNPMVAHLYQNSKQVTVDECYACGGFFLDAGELEVIRENFMAEDAREAYIQQIISNHPEFDSPKEDDVKSGSLDRAKAVAKLTGLFQTL